MAHKTKKKKKKLPSILNHLFQVDIDGNDLGSFFILVVCHFTVPQIISLRGLWRYRKKKKAKQKQNKQKKNSKQFSFSKCENTKCESTNHYSGCLLVGNTAKWQISKQELQENKAFQIFRKTNNSYPLKRTFTCVSGGKQ